MKTMIQKKDNTYDVDLGIYFNEKPAYTCTTVQENVLKAVNKHTTGGASHLQKCIRVIYSGDFNIDLPVYYQLVNDKTARIAVKNGDWRIDDPEEFVKWFSTQRQKEIKNDGQLVRIVKYLKRWANERGFKTPSGAALTVWAGKHFTPKAERDDIALSQTINAIKSSLWWTISCPCSSFEAQDIAIAFKDALQDFAEIKLWLNAFDNGKSNYENLISQIALYDYAILIATGDDETISRTEQKSSPRDNIVFEFGLFAGGLGRSRVFYIVEKGSKLPTDLLGITFPRIPTMKGAEMDKAILESAYSIREHIKSKETTFDLGFLPSTALAYGYFTNFVEKTVHRLLEDRKSNKEFKLEDGTTFHLKEIAFDILIPNDLSDDMYNKVRAKRLKDNWAKIKVDPKDVRDYDFSIDVTRAKDGVLHLVDIPFTLNALYKAVEMYSSKAHLGKDTKETILEQREIRNFQRTLDYLISKSALAKGIVKTSIVNI
ncbi:unnamed protein product [Rotaria sp. Silwood2]|nr:unnamed protein product [Rotaria sp. Silwood2]CAF4003478.1 unnamed protein product [Rotaria sp. Silwood2]